LQPCRLHYKAGKVSNLCLDLNPSCICKYIYIFFDGTSCYGCSYNLQNLYLIRSLMFFRW
jgi:hypothetical protein